MIRQKWWKCLMGKSELGSHAGNSGTRCPGRQEVLEPGGWVWGSRSSKRTSRLGRITVSIPSTCFILQLSGYTKGPLHDHYTRILILWAACLWGCCQGWPKPRLPDDGNTAPRLADTQCGPTLLPALSGHQGRKNNQSQALLSTGLWLLTKMEKTQWISMPHKHHWDGQCRCSLDGGSTFRGCGAGGCVTIWQMVSPDRPTALEKTEKGAMPWGSCPEKLRPISYGSACGITLILFFTYLASSLENPMRTFMKTHT